jgi:2-dehydropantoate 2-reductase
VTFLVRPKRAAMLRQSGLVIRSPIGDATLPVAVVEPAQLTADYDLVMLSCKAYDLEDAIRTVKPAMRRPGAMLLPLLNGLAHYAALDAAFGRDAVLGGLCYISTTLNAAGEVEHMGRGASLTFGERDATHAREDDRTTRIATAFKPAAFESRHSTHIAAAMWEKYAFLSAAAAITSLMRACIGDILSTPEGERLTRQMIAECEGVACAEGFPTSAATRESTARTLTTPGSPFKSSMLRDIEAGHRVEAEHIVGDMLRRARARGIAAPLLEAAFAHLKAYETARSRA